MYRQAAEGPAHRVRCDEDCGRKWREGAATVREGNTRRRHKPRRGADSLELHRFFEHRTHRGEQGPEVDVGFAGAGQTAGGLYQRHEGTGVGETRFCSAEREKPLKARILDVAAG